MQRAHFQVWVGVFSCQQILIEISFVIFDIVLKTNRMSFSVALVKFHWFGIMHWNAFLLLRMQKLLLVYYNSETRATSRIWNVLPNMVFPPIWGEKMADLSMRMQVILDSLFARPGSASILYGAGRKESSGTGLYRTQIILCLTQVSSRLVQHKLATVHLLSKATS